MFENKCNDPASMTPYDEIVIYYFTGTGNSGKVAEWISFVASESNIKVSSINIAQLDRLNIDPPVPGALLIFVSPVHGFNYPPVMMHFIMRFPKGRNNVALMDTRGGLRIGKWVTPGISGIAFYFAALMLRIKGHAIRAMFPVDLPSNWLFLHPGLSSPSVKHLHVRSKAKVMAFARQILRRKTSFNGLKDIIQDAIVAPVAVMYYFVGRFFLAKSFYASVSCTSCGVCQEKCPVNAIKLVDDRPFWTLSCESCMRCMTSCPKRAIESGHGYLTVMMLFYYGVLIGLFYKYAEVFFTKIEHPVLQYLAEIVLFLVLLVAWYRVVHYLLRFKMFSTLVEYTSLTRYKFWGRRYRALKDEEFEGFKLK